VLKCIARPCWHHFVIHRYYDSLCFLTVDIIVASYGTVSSLRWTCVAGTVVNPNNKFEVYVDQSLIHSGSLLEDMTSVAVVAVTVWLLSVFVSLFLCYLCYRNLTPILYTSFHFSGCFPDEPGLAICFLDFSSVCFERVLFGIGTWNTFFTDWTPFLSVFVSQFCVTSVTEISRPYYTHHFILVAVFQLNLG